MIAVADHALRLALDRGLLRPEQLDSIGLAADGPGAMVGLMARGVVDATAWARLAAEEGRLELIDLSRVVPTAEALRRLPRAVAVRHHVCPLAEAGSALLLAVVDPFDLESLDAIAHVAGGPLKLAVATQGDIRRALAQHYVWEAAGEWSGDDLKGAGELTVREGAEGDSGVDDAPIIRLAEEIIAEGMRRRASDIHLEPSGKRLRVRYRVDGVLQDGDSPPQRNQAALISRVKIMANISIAEKRVPQDGRIQRRIEGRPLDLRVATMPTVHGESVVMRLLDRANLSPQLADLGLRAEDGELLERAITAPDGLVLVTGPTGSGKTTTLYAALQRLNDSSRKLITVEDPIEYEIPGINQVPVNTTTGMTFAAALRAMLRQAPNVVMVGEIRDAGTADIALNASLTGHLVFSTLHTNDAAGAVTRLLDIGVKPFLVAAALRLVVAQRLVRRVCERCATPEPLSATERNWLGGERGAHETSGCRRGRGCAHCQGTGYRGRRGIFEMLPVNDELRAAIYQRVTPERLREIARRAGYRTLREDGVSKVLAGLTTIEEVAAVTVAPDVSP